MGSAPVVTLSLCAIFLGGIVYAGPPPSEGVIAYYCPEDYCLRPAASQPDDQDRPVITCALAEHNKTLTTPPEYVGRRRESSRGATRLAPNDTVARDLMIPPYKATMPVIAPKTGWPLAQCCQVCDIAMLNASRCCIGCTLCDNCTRHGSRCTTAHAQHMKAPPNGHP